MNDYDSPWKAMCDAFFKDLIQIFMPDAYKDINWACGFITRDKELLKIRPEARTGRRIADKLVSVEQHDGQKTSVFLHIEFQNQHDPKLGERIYTYHYRIKDYYQQPVVNLVILGDLSKAEPSNEYGYEEWECGLVFRYRVIRLYDYLNRLPELLTSKNTFALITAAYIMARLNQTDTNQRFIEKKTLTLLLYQKGFPKKTVTRLLLFIDWVMSLPEPLEQRYNQEVAALGGEKHMEYVTSFERHALKKGIEQGIEQGVGQGIARSLSMVLTQRLGTIPEPIRKKIANAETAQLEQWFEAVLASNHPEQVFS